MLTFTRNEYGSYDGSTKTFNRTTGEYEPIYRIMGHSGAWSLWEGNQFARGYKTLSEAKQAAQRIEDRKPVYMTDEDMGLANSHYAPGQTVSSYITADGTGGRSYISDDGQSIISERRNPDGTTTTERRPY